MPNERKKQLIIQTINFLFSHGFVELVDLRFLSEVTRSHSGTPHTIGLLWTIDRPVAKSSTWQHT